MYGYLEAHWDISFRYPVDADSEPALSSFVGSSLRKSIQLARDEADAKLGGHSSDSRIGDTPVFVTNKAAALTRRDTGEDDEVKSTISSAFTRRVGSLSADGGYDRVGIKRPPPILPPGK